MNQWNHDEEVILYQEEDIRATVERLGKQITSDYPDTSRPLLLVGILKGAAIFLADLARQIERNVKIDFMMVSSYGNGTESSGKVHILKDLNQDITGMDILLVEDIVDSGLTMHFLKDYLSRRDAASVKICALLDKPARRTCPVEVEYVGFEAPDGFLIGYGVDYAEDLRNLPYIGILKESIYKK